MILQRIVTGLREHKGTQFPSTPKLTGARLYSGWCKYEASAAHGHKGYADMLRRWRVKCDISRSLGVTALAAMALIALSVTSEAQLRNDTGSRSQFPCAVNPASCRPPQPTPQPLQQPQPTPPPDASEYGSSPNEQTTPEDPAAIVRAERQARMAVAEAEAESFATDGRYDEALIAFERALSNCDSENCARLQRRIEDLHRQIELASWNEQRDGGERDSADAAQTALRDLAAGSGSRNTLEDLRPNNETEPINRTGLEFVSPEGDIGDQSYTDTSVVDLGFIDPNRLPVIDPRSARGESQIRDAAGSDSGSQLLTGEALERAEIGARAEASLSLGRAFAERGEHGRAIPYLREALALSPDCMACRQELANAELLNTDTLAWLADEAARYWRDIAREVFGVTAEDVLLEDELQSSSADYILDALLYGDGNWDNSLRYINDVAMARPDDREARDAMMYIRGLVNGVTPLDDNS